MRNELTTEEILVRARTEFSARGSYCLCGESFASWRSERYFTAWTNKISGKFKMQVDGERGISVLEQDKHVSTNLVEIFDRALQIGCITYTHQIRSDVPPSKFRLFSPATFAQYAELWLLDGIPCYRVHTLGEDPIAVWIAADTFQILRVDHFRSDDGFFRQLRNPAFEKMLKFFWLPVLCTLVIHDLVCYMVDKSEWIYIRDGYRDIAIQHYFYLIGQSKNKVHKAERRHYD